MVSVTCATTDGDAGRGATNHTGALELPEASRAWQMRGHWAKQDVVAVTLTDRCLLRTVVGRVSCVAATGAYAVIDGWSLPMVDVLRVVRATVEDRDRYAAAVEAARAEAKDGWT